jgi:predicted metal-dependent peptidase
MNTTLEQAFTYLLSSQVRDFCARVVSALQRIPVPGLGTMGVGISRGGRLCLFYDPEFVAQIPMAKLRLVCQHELIHLICDHIPRYLNLLSTLTDDAEKRKFRAVMNVAADCADNELIRGEKNFDQSKLAKHFYGTPGSTDAKDAPFLVPEQFQLPRNQPYEVYQLALVKRVRTVHITGVGGAEGLEKAFSEATGGSHDQWDNNLDKSTSEELQGLADRLQQEAKNVAAKALEEHNRDPKNRGTIPAGIEQLLGRFLARPTIPWPTILRTLVLRTRQTKLARGMARPNRRMFGIPHVLPFPGRARDRRFSIYFALDTSGSMGTEELQRGLAELINIVRMESDVALHVIYCDAALQTIYDITSEDEIDLTVKGRGGTDFNPVFQHVQRHLTGDKACDVLVYCTDGYAPAPEPENRVPIPVIWLYTPGHAVPCPDYGIHLTMEDV